MDPQLQHDVDSDKKKTPFNVYAKQHRASSSEIPTHNNKNRQASSRAVLPSVPFVYRRLVAPEKKTVILRSPGQVNHAFCSQ